jgi:hypothetical protein
LIVKQICVTELKVETVDDVVCVDVMVVEDPVDDVDEDVAVEPVEAVEADVADVADDVVVADEVVDDVVVELEADCVDVDVLVVATVVVVEGTVVVTVVRAVVPVDVALDCVEDVLDVMTGRCGVNGRQSFAPPGRTRSSHSCAPVSSAVCIRPRSGWRRNVVRLPTPVRPVVIGPIPTAIQRERRHVAPSPSKIRCCHMTPGSPMSIRV